MVGLFVVFLTAIRNQSGNKNIRQCRSSFRYYCLIMYIFCIAHRSSSKALIVRDRVVSYCTGVPYKLHFLLFCTQLIGPKILTIVGEKKNNVPTSGCCIKICICRSTTQHL